MPDFMKTEFTRYKVEYFGDVDNGPKGIDDAADNEPAKYPGRKRRK